MTILMAPMSAGNPGTARFDHATIGAFGDIACPSATVCEAVCENASTIKGTMMGIVDGTFGPN